MPRSLIFVALLLVASPAIAQNWPTETGFRGDAIGGAFAAFDRLGANPQAPSVGDDRREGITGWLGGIQNWVEERSEMVGDRQPQSTGYYQLRRSWEREWSLGR
jgi:hypothetical protein